MSQQLEFFDITSPCIRVCETDERGYCKGCYRSRVERFEWQKMSNDDKRNVLRLCRQRYARKKRALAAQQEETSPASLTQQTSLFDE